MRSIRAPWSHGCKLYFLRWWVPAAVTRMWTIGRPRPSAIAGSTIRYR